jgi:segregation and condensation protein B
MNEFYIRNVVEAALLAAGKSLQLPELGQVFDENARPKAEEIRAALEVLATEYSSRGVEVKETAAGFRIQVRKEFAAEISRLWPERPAKYSRALLETVALIAYRQPITRAEIEAVRGVAVNPNILKTVIERNWVRVVGHRDVPGRPELLGTTRDFLDYFGLRSLDELPALAELKAMGEYNLQLELPNAGALGIEAPGNGAEVAGEVGGADPGDAEVASSDFTDVPSSDATSADATVADVADVDVTSVEVTVIEFEGVDLSGPDLAPDVVDAPSLAWSPVTDSDAAAAVGNGEERGDGEKADLGEAIDAEVDVESDEDDDGVDDDAEADRTLSVDSVARSGGTSDADAADSDDSGPADRVASDESSDAPGDDGDDDDELSADGHDSRELVAAPRDVDD